jgi:hypothetical protein
MDCDSLLWSDKLFLFFVNLTSHNIGFQSINDLTTTLLVRYTKDVLIILRHRCGRDQVRIDEDVFLPQTLSSFLLEALPKGSFLSIMSLTFHTEMNSFALHSKSSNHLESISVFLPSTHSPIYLLFSLANLFSQSPPLLQVVLYILLPHSSLLI